MSSARRVREALGTPTFSADKTELAAADKTGPPFAEASVCNLRGVVLATTGKTRIIYTDDAVLKRFTSGDAPVGSTSAASGCSDRLPQV